MRAVVVGVGLDLALLLLAFAVLALRALPRAVPLAAVRFVVEDRYWMLIPPLVCALIAAIVVGLRRAPLSRVARETDSLLDLDERLGTALELEELAARTPPSERTSDLAIRQRADAVEALRRHEPAEAYPIHLRRREVIATSVACLLLVALVLVPEVTGRSDRQLAAAAARAEAERLSALADEIAADSSLSLEDRAAMAAALDQAALDLEANASDSEFALSELGEGERSLAQQANAGGDSSHLALSRVADALDQAAPSREVAARIDRGDYSGAAEELSRLGEQADSLGDRDRAALTDALNRAARGTSRLDPQLSDTLGQAASSLGQGSQQSPESAFAQAGEQLRHTGQDAARQQALERALAALQGAKASVGRAQSGAGDPARAEAGAAGEFGEFGGEPEGSAGTDRSSDGLGQGSMGGDAGAAPAGGQGEQAIGDSPGGSGAGSGSLAREGPNEAGDFRSRVVKVPTDQFGDPTISSGQSSNEGPVGEATVDYRQVIADYRQRATDAMAQRYIPPSLKDLVAAYFTSLDSGSSASTGSQGGTAR